MSLPPILPILPGLAGLAGLTGLAGGRAAGQGQGLGGGPAGNPAGGGFSAGSAAAGAAASAPVEAALRLVGQVPAAHPARGSWVPATVTAPAAGGLVTLEAAGAEIVLRGAAGPLMPALAAGASLRLRLDGGTARLRVAPEAPAGSAPQPAQSMAPPRGGLSGLAALAMATESLRQGQGAAALRRTAEPAAPAPAAQAAGGAAAGLMPLAAVQAVLLHLLPLHQAAPLRRLARGRPDPRREGEDAPPEDQGRRDPSTPEREPDAQDTAPPEAILFDLGGVPHQAEMRQQAEPEPRILIETELAACGRVRLTAEPAPGGAVALHCRSERPVPDADWEELTTMARARAGAAGVALVLSRSTGPLDPAAG
ncbi:hypothetical protein [Pseudoroseicyclus aestuarii]|uniref:Flagellar hook-length control protein FliK n=1 Tax=Pseudoroseicyclus aestuarii TaxID=1795041 RepID=A0A318ST54_9RHOB|nr:hypothetical protein [Pseudoroseicyclus aestuarii]PYE84515.1 hypothetical protein DFP88_102315 [Pseudoroseicyclus aestuarii]